jgi:GNAT superfamily N-acetyltransferase
MLKKAFPKVEFIGEKEAREILGDKGIKVNEMRTSDGNVFGFEYKGKIFLDETAINADTPIHEVVGHYGMNIIDAMAKGGDEKAQAIIAKGFSLLQAPEGKAVLDEIKANPAYSNLSLMEKKMEALATIIGREGANMFTEGTRKNTFASKVKDFIKSFYDYIRTKVSTLKDKTIKQIAAMDNKEFIRAIVGDAFRGEIVQQNNESLSDDKVMLQAQKEADSITLKYNGKGQHLAPNGKPSNLTEQQAKIVRTEAFKNWFGDWESNATASLDVKDFSKYLQNKYDGLTTLFLSESNGVISIDMIEVDSAMRKGGIGTSVMNDILLYADINGKEISLIPALKDDRKGTTSRNRLVDFYKRFGFVENTGRNKDFSKKSGSMFRLPKNNPQNASKVVDENGEPLVTYRAEYTGDNVLKSYKNIGIHLVDNLEVANDYNKSNEILFNKINQLSEEEIKQILPISIDDLNDILDNTDKIKKLLEQIKTPLPTTKVFSTFNSIKNPLIINNEFIDNFKEYLKGLYSISDNAKKDLLIKLKDWHDGNKGNVWKLLVNNNSLEQILDVYIKGDFIDTGTPLNKATDKNFGYQEMESLYPILKDFISINRYDGIIRKHDVYSDSKTNDNEIIAFKPNQIKLADGTNTTFNPNTNDIRFQASPKTDLQEAERKLKEAWGKYLSNGISFDGMAEAEKERQLIVALLGYLKAKGIDIAKGIGNEVRDFIKNKFSGVTDEMIDVAQGRMLTDYQKLYDTHMTPKNKEILDGMVSQVKSGEMSFEDFINTIDGIVPNERIKNVFISYVNEQIDPLDGYVAVDEEIEEVPESPKTETSKEEERAFIGGLLARPINRKNFPNIVGDNKTDDDVLKRITAVTQEDVQDRKVMVDTSYVRVALENIKEIALQNANALYMQFGEDWQNKVMDYLSDYLNAANPAQAIGILNVISTDVQQKIEKSQSPTERTKLFKLQDKADELSILFASQASLGINARKILRQFAQGGNMSKLVLDKILTEDTMQTIEEINRIAASKPTNEELNNATLPVQAPQTPKSRIQKIKQNVKAALSSKQKNKPKITEKEINELGRRAEEERKRQGVQTKMSRQQIAQMLKEEAKKC